MNKKWRWVGGGIITLIIGGIIVIKTLLGGSSSGTGAVVPTSSNNPEDQHASAIAAGKALSGGNCEGEGPGVLTRLPMDTADYSYILPYGLMVGGHVTPIDHQYFSPAIFNSPRDTYPVYAMADSKIVDIQPRTNDRGTEYRFVFTMSCTFLYYYDLVTSLAPDIQAAYDKANGGPVDIDVTPGQLVGRIGGQTLDFAVWDTTKPLKNFIVPEHYVGESWKIYTADPLDYYSPAAKAEALAKYMRATAPLSGRIDYDIDGKLIGTWFEVGTNGYAGATGNTGAHEYWAGHLAIAPEYLDNSAFITSFGNWAGGEASQFIVMAPFDDPATVGVETDAVKYELYQPDYRQADGTSWDRTSINQNLQAIPNKSKLGGCVMFKLTDTRLLKVEQFPNQKCANVLAFTANAKTYER